MAERWKAVTYRCACGCNGRRSSCSDSTVSHLAQLPRERRIEVLVPNLGALPQAVVGTRRLATMHRLYAEHVALLYPISIHSLPIPVPDIVEIAQWHATREQDGGVRWLLDLMGDQAARLPVRMSLQDIERPPVDGTA